ncbi:C40 family peptidase [Hymenobacter rubripertinctus]|uniref:NlpC/P60 family protein n=1 Tax=Hymenobacter rubripertinctus TaxID=2029981 RepID=A0A418QIL9_9BACT|nr:C40 family peptidase [Hymenobacter rubripertinctus]RIY05026.1 NlpC/P60 family protein [Hymenobacter rubripertinctus]
MRYIWLVFLLLIALLLGWVWQARLQPVSPVLARQPAVYAPGRPTAYVISNPAPARPEPPVPVAAALKADSVVAFALRQMGTNYCYAGTTPATGFDCSGFVLYVFARYDVPMPHSTALLIDVGRPVPRAQARPGDIVVFTGTASTSTTPGHAGIVLSQPGEPLRFVHSSSARRESGVKISQVEGTGYERRFMQVRRVL